MGTAKLPRGFGAGPAPGATATDCASSTGPSPALPFRRSFPGLFPALLFSTAIYGRAGLLQRLRELLLLFLRSFLGFSLLRHHKPPSKVKEASTAPVELRRAIRPPGVTRRRISCRSAHRATQKLFFRANRLQEPTTLRKKFSAALHILSKAARSFWRKTTVSLRTREAHKPPLGFAPLRIRASMRARERTNSSRSCFERFVCHLAISGTQVSTTVSAELSRRDVCAIARAFRSSMSSYQSPLFGNVFARGGARFTRRRRLILQSSPVGERTSWW